MHQKAAWLHGLNYLQANGLALIGQSLGLSISDNNMLKNNISNIEKLFSFLRQLI